MHDSGERRFKLTTGEAMLEVWFGRINERTVTGEPARSDWVVTNRKCWFVRVVATNGTAAIPMEFARKVDATRAKESIMDICSWDGTLSEIHSRLCDVTVRDIKRKMVENLAW